MTSEYGLAPSTRSVACRSLCCLYLQCPAHLDVIGWPVRVNRISSPSSCQRPPQVGLRSEALTLPKWQLGYRAQVRRCDTSYPEPLC